MSLASEIGLPRGGRGRIRLDTKRLLALRAEGYSLRQIAKALGVSDATVRARLREQTHAAPDPFFSALGKKGQRARRRALRRRKKEAEEAAKRAREASAQGDLLKLGMALIVAEKLGGLPPAPKNDEVPPGYGP